MKSGLANLFEFSHYLLIGRPLSVIHLDELPAYDPLRVDDVGRWVWPAFAVRVKDPIAVDDFVAFVL